MENSATFVRSPQWNTSAKPQAPAASTPTVASTSNGAKKKFSLKGFSDKFKDKKKITMMSAGGVVLLLIVGLVLMNRSFKRRNNAIEKHQPTVDVLNRGQHDRGPAAEQPPQQQQPSTAPAQPHQQQQPGQFAPPQAQYPPFQQPQQDSGAGYDPQMASQLRQQQRQQQDAMFRQWNEQQMGGTQAMAQMGGIPPPHAVPPGQMPWPAATSGAGGGVPIVTGGGGMAPPPSMGHGGFVAPGQMPDLGIAQPGGYNQQQQGGGGYGGPPAPGSPDDLGYTEV